MTNLPITGKFSITATYKQVNKNLWATYHKGLDFVSNNKKIYSTCDGVVYNTGYDANGWGYWVSVKDSAGRRHIFCHMVKGSVNVAKGDKVTRTTVLGTMGATGNVTGVHLHYQINNSKGKDINPCDYLGIPNKKGTYDSKDFQIDVEQKKEEKNTFKDASKIDAWAKSYVDKVFASGIMIGDDKGNFNPTKPVTRAEMATIVYRGWENEAVFKNTASKAHSRFKDVVNTAWYYSAVDACYKAGIVTGDGNGNFNPDKSVTRQDAVLMLVRINYTNEQLKKIDVNKLIIESGVEPTDFNDVSQYAQPAMAITLGNLIVGDDNGAIKPLNTITRQELAAVIVRALKL